MNKLNISIIAVLLVLLLGFGIYFITSNRHGSADTTDKLTSAIDATIIAGKAKYKNGASASGLTVVLDGYIATTDGGGSYQITGYGAGNHYIEFYNNNDAILRFVNQNDAEVFLNGTFLSHDVTLENP